MSRSKPKFLSPLNDVVFKLLFTRPDCEDLLLSLLNALFRPLEPIVSARILNPDLPRGIVKNRGVVLDIHVQAGNGTEADIEMQARKRVAMRGRMVYHWSRLFGFQLEAGQNHESLRRCVSVFFVGYNELPSGRFHSTFRVLETHGHEELTDLLELHVVQLRRWAEGSSEEADLVGWSRFFMATTEQEREALSMSSEALAKANRILAELSANPEVQRLVREREDAEANYSIDMGGAKAEGKKLGEKLGEKRGEKRGRKLGEKRGRKLGEKQGLLVGERRMLLNFLRKRFPDAPEAAFERVEKASAAQLSRWANALLGAESLDAWLVAIRRPRRGT